MSQFWNGKCYARERETYFGLSHRNDQVWKKENKFVGCKNGWEQDRSTKQAKRTRNSIHHVEKVQANSIEIPKYTQDKCDACSKCMYICIVATQATTIIHRSNWNWTNTPNHIIHSARSRRTRKMCVLSHFLPKTKLPYRIHFHSLWVLLGYFILIRFRIWSLTGPLLLHTSFILLYIFIVGEILCAFNNQRSGKDRMNVIFWPVKRREDGSEKKIRRRRLRRCCEPTADVFCSHCT